VLFHYVCPYYYTLLERLFCYIIPTCPSALSYQYVRKTESKIKKTKNKTHTRARISFIRYTDYHLVYCRVALSEMDLAFYLGRQYKTTIFFSLKIITYIRNEDNKNKINNNNARAHTHTVHRTPSSPGRRMVIIIQFRRELDWTRKLYSRNLVFSFPNNNY